METVTDGPPVYTLTGEYRSTSYDTLPGTTSFRVEASGPMHIESSYASLSVELGVPAELAFHIHHSGQDGETGVVSGTGVDLQPDADVAPWLASFGNEDYFFLAVFPSPITSPVDIIDKAFIHVLVGQGQNGAELLAWKVGNVTLQAGDSFGVIAMSHGKGDDISWDIEGGSGRVSHMGFAHRDGLYHRSTFAPQGAAAAGPREIVHAHNDGPYGSKDPDVVWWVAWARLWEAPGGAWAGTASRTPTLGLYGTETPEEVPTAVQSRGEVTLEMPWLGEEDAGRTMWIRAAWHGEGADREPGHGFMESMAIPILKPVASPARDEGG